MAHELIKGYNHKTIFPGCLIKVDIRKAYDSVEWKFLKAVLLEFGIPYKIVVLIMKYVSTVSYSLLVNGGLTKSFDARKGLRQGDPMSPYLFVLAMEYLTRSLKKLHINPDFNFHPKCSKLQIIHICFADDLLLCCRADETSMKLMMNEFEQFSKASGLQANMDKSSLYIAGVSTNFKEKICSYLHLTEGTLPFKYLGVPLSTKKVTISQYMFLVEKITFGRG